MQHSAISMTKPSIVLCILIGIFGIGSWIDINGLWVETPLLVQSAPEKWSLTSYLVIIIQIANIGPLLYLLLNKLSKGSIGERPVIYIILLVGMSSCILLALFWKHTVHVFGSLRSIPLLILTLCLAFVDCTSSLVFLPYMASFPYPYLIALYIGEGCSGLIPGIVALIQGVGGKASCVNSTDINGTYHVTPVYPPPNFSVEEFFWFLGVMLLCSLIAFGLVDCHPAFKKYRISQTSAEESESLRGNANHDENAEGDFGRYTDSSNPMVESISNQCYLPNNKTCIVLLIFVMWINGLSNGFLPSLQTYASIPYGNIPYHLSVTLSNIVNPAACFLTFFWKLKDSKCIGLMTAVGTLIAAYLTYLSFASPNPPMADVFGGKLLLVLSWFLLTAIFSYSKTAIGLILQTKGKKYLTLCGFFTQVGSFGGALLAFLIVNVFHLLHQKSPC